jgi:hypothetical protein
MTSLEYSDEINELEEKQAAIKSNIRAKKLRKEGKALEFIPRHPMLTC